MEQHKISQLLNNSTVSKFLTRKSIKVNYLSGAQYSFSKNIRLESPMLRSDLSDYGGAYIAVTGRITIEGTNDANKKKIFNL